MRTRNHHPRLFGLFSRNNGGRRENNACSRCGSPLYLHCEECRWIGRGRRRRGRCWLARVGQIDVFKIVVGVIVASVIIGWLEAKARWPRGGRWTGTVPPLRWLRPFLRTSSSSWTHSQKDRLLLCREEFRVTSVSRSNQPLFSILSSE